MTPDTHIHTGQLNGRAYIDGIPGRRVQDQVSEDRREGVAAGVSRPRAGLDAHSPSAASQRFWRQAGESVRKSGVPGCRMQRQIAAAKRWR